MYSGPPPRQQSDAPAAHHDRDGHRATQPDAPAARCLRDHHDVVPAAPEQPQHSHSTPACRGDGDGEHSSSRSHLRHLHAVCIEHSATSQRDLGHVRVRRVSTETSLRLFSDCVPCNHHTVTRQSNTWREARRQHRFKKRPFPRPRAGAHGWHCEAPPHATAHGHIAATCPSCRLNDLASVMTLFEYS